MNRITQKAPALKESDLAAIEKKLGFQLPTELRAHYLKHNGGVPAKRYFVDARGTEFELQRFMSMKEPAFDGDVLFGTTYENLVVKKKLIPMNLVPFARGSGGDFYCIDRSDGSVCFYAMDHALEPKRATKKVAKSLAEFIDGMQAEL
jgi:cell wall assembly regulator SMI1